MDMVKLGKRGQVRIPREVLERLGLQGEDFLLVDTTPDGAIVLRPTGVYAIEMYSDERVREFLEEDALTAEERVRLQRLS